MGNRLLLFCHFAAAAEELGFHLHDFALAPYRHDFSGLRQNPFFRYPGQKTFFDAGRLTQIFRKPLMGLLRRFLARKQPNRFGIFGHDTNLHASTPLRLDGPEFSRMLAQARILMPWGYNYRCLPWLARHREKIRAFLKPCGMQALQGTKLLASAKKDGGLLIGLHLRIAEDMRTWEEGRHFHPLSFYVEQVRNLLRLGTGKRITVLACSDRPLPRDLFAGMPVHQANRSRMEDFAILHGCDYLLGVPSSFLHMASFLGGKPLFTIRTRSHFPTSWEDFQIADGANA